MKKYKNLHVRTGLKTGPVQDNQPTRSDAIVDAIPFSQSGNFVPGTCIYWVY